ncbi:MAG: DUF5309 family protein [Pseudomonadota bacterium]
MVAIMKSYDQIGRKEDISNIISNITPTKTPFQSMIGSESIHNIVHSWQEDALAAVAANAAVEGADAPTAVHTATVLRTGTTQIFTKTAKVSGTTEAVDTYGRDRELAYQLSLKGAELKRDHEYAMVGVSQAQITGSVSVARQFASYLAQLDGTAVYTVNSTSGALNTALTSQTAAALREDIITLVSQTLYTNGSDPDCLMVKPADSLVLSGFQASGRTRFVDNGTRNITNVVDVYTSPFGTLKVYMNRFQLASSALIFEASMWKKLVLRNWARKTLAVTGDSTNIQLVGEFGLKHKNQAASGGVINLT